MIVLVTWFLICDMCSYCRTDRFWDRGGRRISTRYLEELTGLIESFTAKLTPTLDSLSEVVESINDDILTANFISLKEKMNDLQTEDCQQELNTILSMIKDNRIGKHIWRKTIAINPHVISLINDEHRFFKPLADKARGLTNPPEAVRLLTKHFPAYTTLQTEEVTSSRKGKEPISDDEESVVSNSDSSSIV